MKITRLHVNHNPVKVLTMGRKSTYDPELCEKILDRMRSGETLTAICAEPENPPIATFCRWADAHFPEEYARTREIQGHAVAELAYRRATSEQTGDWARDRLAFDAGRWFAGKVAPKHYGDKVTTAHTGPDGGAVQVETKQTPLETARAVAFLLAAGAAQAEKPASTTDTEDSI